HLAKCDGCRKEYRALQGVRRLLGTAAPPEVQLDLPRLYRQAMEGQVRRLRRWRRVAVAVTAVAALVACCAVGLRLEARVEPHQLVLRWGSPPPLPEPNIPEAAPPATGSSARLLAAQPVSLSDEQLQLYSKLIHALADDLQTLERRQRRDEDQYQTALRNLHDQTLERCAALERDLHALYVLHNKGE